MKAPFSGMKLSKMKGYSNLYMDSFISKEELKTTECQLAIKKAFKSLKFNKKDSSSSYIILSFIHGVDILAIRNMSYYRSIAKAFNAPDIVFIHNYLLHHTGTGQLMFPPGSFDKVKEMYL